MPPTPTRSRSIVTLGLIALAALALPGCLRSATIIEREPYPKNYTTIEPSNIQIYRQGRSITLTNTTATNFGPSTIWLNRWFSRDIEALDIGQTLTLSLVDFKDEYDDHFKGGGFFATTAPERIVHAELETQLDTDRVLLPLIVVGQREY